MQLRGKCATVFGLGRHGGGAAAARFLAARGARVTVTDLAPEEQLADSLAQLEDVPIQRFTLGGHSADDFRNADVVIVNPAVRLDHPLLHIATDAGAEITSEIEIFLAHCPAPVIGVTGSNGKSTTAAMIDEILRADGRKTWLGGNIGRSLLNDLESIGPHDQAVLEMSSFQLAQLGPQARLPEVSVVTGCTPNHLDWHDTWDAFRAAKQRILGPANSDAKAVLNLHDAEVARWTTARQVQPPVPLPRIPELRVPGRHNRINAACAAAATMAVGCDWTSIDRGLRGFRGLPHRLELVAEHHGRLFYNDSMATTPESTIAALDTLDRPVWLLAGGKNKGADLTELSAAVVRCARGGCFFGACRRDLTRHVSRLCPALRRDDFGETETLDAALAWCWPRTSPGDALLLSPACSSLDQFRDYRHRAEVFLQSASAIAGECWRVVTHENIS